MMRSCVSVPVLSVHSTSIAPKFWIALSRLTMTFLRDIAIAPLERQTVTIIGSISGVRPDRHGDREEEAPRSQLPLVRPLMTKTSGTMTTMKRIISQVNRLMPWSKLVGTRCPAMLVGQLAEVRVARRWRTTTPWPMPLTDARCP